VPNRATPNGQAEHLVKGHQGQPVDGYVRIQHDTRTSSFARY